MARGFDSKNVEEQQAEALRKPDPSRPQMTAEQKRKAGERALLELQLARVNADIARATSDRHRAMLESAKNDLEKKIAGLK